MKIFTLTLLFITALFESTQLWAKVSDSEANQLGKNLTPMGAEKAGNKDGSIPEWDGGIVKPIAGYTEGEHHLDPYASEKPLFKINQANIDKYADKLSEGQINLLKKNPEYYLNVYPTHRSTAYSQKIYDATLKNATTAELDDNGNGVINTKVSVPFPIPKTALEVMWNHILRYRGENLYQKAYSAAVDRTGSFVPILEESKVIFNYAQGGEQDADLMLAITRETLEPTRLAGGIFLVREAVNQAKVPRQAWAYSKGQRRVRRAPTIAYDTYQPSADGLKIIDEVDMFNGAPDRFDWKLLGKKELYIPYNNYKVNSAEANLDNLINKNHLNPKYLRYELHRVWMVEATLKPGKRHVYGKRVFYIDEDSWQITVADSYDKRGQLWRMAEGFSINFYEEPVQLFVLESQYDFTANRYFVTGAHNGLPPTNLDVTHPRQNFKPSSLRRQGIK